MSKPSVDDVTRWISDYAEARKKALEAKNLKVPAPDPVVCRLQATHAESLAQRLEPRGAVALLRDRPGAGKSVVSLAVARRLVELKAVTRAIIIATNDGIAEKWETEEAKWFWGGARPDEIRFMRRSKIVRCFDDDDQEFKELGHALPCRDTLVVIDEAHRGTQTEGSSNHEALSAYCRGARTLLVTATPFQITSGGFVRMLELNRSDEDESRPEFEALKRYGIAVHKLITRWRARGRLPDQDEQFKGAVERFHEHLDAATDVMRILGPDEMPGSPPVEFPKANVAKVDGDDGDWALTLQVAQLCPNLVEGSRSSDILLRMLVSSAEAFLGSKFWTTTYKPKGASPEALLKAELETRLKTKGGHPKVRHTVSLVVEQVKMKPPRHVLVFCVFRATQQALADAIHDALGERAIVAAPQDLLELDRLDLGGQSLRTRFRSVPGKTPVVLVVRDNLSEGIDLDGGVPALIHHDLPWNPARMNQRWGRVVRRGTNMTKPAAHFASLLPFDADLRLFKVLESRRAQVEFMIPDSASRQGDSGGDDFPWHAVLNHRTTEGRRGR
jgi:superfamily II DNA or RNA helicase